jgi:vacuolar-type H+-ATPase subunit H
MTAHASSKILETIVDDDERAERVMAMPPRSAIGTAAVPVAVLAAPAVSPMMSPDEALQVLALAQRTAENHITAANRHAHQVRSEALASAEQIRLEAHAYAEKVREEADRLREEARAAAEMSGREADAQAAEIRGQAESALADARTEADRIVAGGRDRAEQLDLRAEQRYEDAVGSLAIKREALQKQIEALAMFDADYRQRLALFMHTQLRALWIEQSGEHETDAETPVPGGPVGAHHLS